MRYPVRLKKEAARELEHLPQEARLRLVYAMVYVGQTPTRPSPRLSIKQMRGHPGFWRLAVGPWRAIYRFDGETVLFYMFGHRGTIYQQFESSS